MKTLLIAAIMVATVAVTGIQTVSAHGGNYRGGYGYCGEDEQEPSATRGPNAGDNEKFQKETAGIRKEIAVKRSELKALYRQDNPDEKRAAQLTGELFDLEESLSGKADEAGVRGRFDHGPSMMRNDDRGRGRGRHMMDW